MPLLPSDWSTVLALETPVAELLVRGSVLYLAIIAFMRIVPRRTGGELATMDLVFVFLIAEAAAHSFGDYTAIADGLVVVLVLVAWNYLLNVASFYFPAVERLLSAAPLEVVRDGRLLRRNMRRELLTEQELMDHLRRNGFEDLTQVKRACVESEGQITAIGRERH